MSNINMPKNLSTEQDINEFVANLMSDMREQVSKSLDDIKSGKFEEEFQANFKKRMDPIDEEFKRNLDEQLKREEEYQKQMKKNKRAAKFMDGLVGGAAIALIGIAAYHIFKK